jgi:hypothetical protein
MTTKSKTRKAPAAKTTAPKPARKKGVLSIIRDFLTIDRKPKAAAPKRREGANMFAAHNVGRMIELLKIHAIVRTARVLLVIASAADYVRKVACRNAEALAIEATAWCDARDAAYRRARRG